jgi:hypothetical protein
LCGDHAVVVGKNRHLCPAHAQAVRVGQTFPLQLE